MTSTLADIDNALPDHFPREVSDDGIAICGNAVDVADCLIKNGIVLDGFITDPPWMPPATAFTKDSKGGKKKTGRTWADMSILGIAFRHIFSQLRALQRDGGATVVFCGDVSGAVFAPHLYENWQTIQLLTWEKNTGRIMPPFLCKNEFAWWCADGVGKPAAGMTKAGSANKATLKFSIASKEERVHPSEKPIDMLEHLIGLAIPPGGIVGDFFSGSFSLARAARNTERKFVCVEMDHEFYDRAVDKMRHKKTQRGMV